MIKNSLISSQLITPSVVESFANKTVLVTGASGFIGKVLVEKLLRCCPSITNIYILMRSKKNVSPSERWNAVTQQEVFDRLKEENPDALSKVKVIDGDVLKKGLGLSESDRKILEDEVAIVFHSAASVRFNDSITEAVLLNTRGSLEMIKLAYKMKKLTCFVYVSTTYSNSHLTIPLTEEKIYPSTLNYKTIIKLAETQNAAELALLSQKILGKHPNTYTFSKYLAEQIMNDLAFELPIVIVRPSVVINSIHEPVSGWVDNLNGILGIVAGITKGVLRVFLAKESCFLDYVAVDYAVNSLIVAAWHKSVFGEKSKKALTVYNCAYGNIRRATFGDLMEFGMKIASARPYKDLVWHPCVIKLTENSAIYTVFFYLFQLFPAILADTYLNITGSKPMLVKLHRKIYTTSYALRIFASQHFAFSNKNLLSLWRSLSKNDQIVFFMDPPEEMTIQNITEIAHVGLKRFIFKDDETDVPKCLSNARRFYWMDRSIRCLVLLICLSVLYKMFLYCQGYCFTYFEINSL